MADHICAQCGKIIAGSDGMKLQWPHHPDCWLDRWRVRWSKAGPQEKVRIEAYIATMQAYQ